MKKYLLLTPFLLFSVGAYANYNYDLETTELYHSDSYKLIQNEKENLNEFLEDHHKKYNSLRIIEKTKINQLRVEDICEDIYYGRNDFIYNPIEAMNCLYLLTRQMKPRAAVKLINIHINEGDFQSAAFYYGVFKGISDRHNIGAKRFIENNLDEANFKNLYLKGIKYSINMELINNGENFNDDFFIFNYLDFNESYDFDIYKSLQNKNFSNFADLMRDKENSGNRLLLLTQASNLNRISEYCFLESNFDIAFNCLSAIIQSEKNESALKRMAYLLNNFLGDNQFDDEKIVTVFGFNSNDSLTRRFFQNYIGNDLEKIEHFSYYYNKGKMLNINYNNTGEENDQN